MHKFHQQTQKCFHILKMTIHEMKAIFNEHKTEPFNFYLNILIKVVEKKKQSDNFS